MYRILMPSGTYLEGNFDLNFELSNQVFSTSTASVLPGSFSFPADVPLTDANKVALGNPHLVTNAKNWKTYEGVWVECHGLKMFYGTMTIKACSPTKCRVTIVANPISTVRDLKLNEIDLGGDRDKGTFLTWGLLMFDTTRVPEDHDFLFVPMLNRENNGYEYDSLDPDWEYKAWYNFLTVSPSLEFDMRTGALVPFVKLEYLLERIFAAEPNGFTFVNAWQTEVELKRLYVFNNWDMRTLNSDQEPDLPDTINLANHVPAVKCAEFLKKVIAQHCLGLFTNVFSRSIRLVSLEAILRRPPARDWSEYAIGEMSLEDRDDIPLVYNYEQPEERPYDVPAPEDIATVFNTTADFFAAVGLGLADGYYYIETEHAIVQYKSGGFFVPYAAWLQHRGVILGDGERFDTGMETLLHASSGYYYNAPVVASRFFEETNDLGDTVYERRRTDPPVALFFYRGYNDVGFANNYPVASNHVWNSEETGGVRLDLTDDEDVVGTASRSLNWFGDYGLFEKAHKRWAYMLKDGKPVLQQFALPVAALVDFSFEEKIRVLSMDYFVKKLKIGKPLGNGRVLVEASLVSVI